MSEGSRLFASLLEQARAGDDTASRQLFSVAYEQLKRVARAQRRDRQNGTLNTTALVHEAFVKLGGGGRFEARDKAHFLATAAMAMRQVLIDEARKRLAHKRGGGRVAVSFDQIEEALGDATAFSDAQAEAILALDDSLLALSQWSERHARVVECRFFAGLSIEETAEALKTSPATVKRDWSLAKAWLFRDLRDTP